jgi:hypothetical protein
MKNIYFEDETISENDLYFLCYMIERVARKLHQKNSYVVNKISRDEWMRLISIADVQHCENPMQVEDEWITEYQMECGNFDIKEVDSELAEHIPTEIQMGKVYTRLIVDTHLPDENFVDGMIRIYNDVICEKIDDYNCGAYYEPSYFLARAYSEGGF